MSASQDVGAFNTVGSTLSSFLISGLDKDRFQDMEGSTETTNITQETSTLPPGNPFILPWWQLVFFITLFLGMIIVSIGGNIIVMWIVLWHKRMRTVTNYFLFNLALADALISIWNTIFNSAYLLYSNWWFGEDFCKFSMFIAPCTTSASVFTFMAIAIDRYVQLCTMFMGLIIFMLIVLKQTKNILAI